MNFAVFLGPFLFSCSFSFFLQLKWNFAFLMIHWHPFPSSILMTPKRNLIICHLIVAPFLLLVCLFHCQVQHLHGCFVCGSVSWSWPASSISQMMLSQSSHHLLLSQPQSQVAQVENTIVQKAGNWFEWDHQQANGNKKFKSLIVPWAFSSKNFV